MAAATLAPMQRDRMHQAQQQHLRSLRRQAPRALDPVVQVGDRAQGHHLEVTILTTLAEGITMIADTVATMVAAARTFAS